MPIHQMAKKYLSCWKKLIIPIKLLYLILKEATNLIPSLDQSVRSVKYPVITDHENNISIFESGAILIYLAEKSGKFYDKDNRISINQWLIGQVAYVGPLLGQHHQFHHYTPGKSKWGEDRYFKIAKTIYKDLDERLEKSKFLAGNEYTIADMATFPWIARHPIHDIGLKNFINLSRWYNTISKREAVIRGFDGLKKGEKIPEI